LAADCAADFAECQDRSGKSIAVYLVLIFPANLFAAREGISRKYRTCLAMDKAYWTADFHCMGDVYCKMGKKLKQ